MSLSTNIHINIQYTRVIYVRLFWNMYIFGTFFWIHINYITLCTVVIYSVLIVCNATVQHLVGLGLLCLIYFWAKRTLNIFVEWEFAPGLGGGREIWWLRRALAKSSWKRIFNLSCIIVESVYKTQPNIALLFVRASVVIGVVRLSYPFHQLISIYMNSLVTILKKFKWEKLTTVQYNR